MIDIRFTADDSGQWQSVTASGHALSGEFGHDLVCSAVSVTLIGLANNLERLTGVAPLVEQAASGYLRIERPAGLDARQADIFQLLMESAYRTLHDDVEAEYGRYLIVKRS